jgi:putative peptidoglycan lipid II flippase
VNVSRVMFALGRLKVAAVALGGSWLLVTVADVVLAELAPAHLVVAALALGSTIGMTVVAVPLLIATRRIRGRAAVEGVGRSALAGLAAGAAGAAAGVAVTMTVPISGKLVAAGMAVLAAGCAVIAFGVVSYVLDKRDLVAVTLRLRRFARSRS